MSDDDAARAALRARQGAGARYDAATAPHDDLLLMRRGTAFFARKLNELSDADLDAPIPGESRRAIVARVSYEARDMAEALAAGAPALAAPEPSRLARGAGLPHRALRALFHHTEVHLNVVLRDLDDAAWDRAFGLPESADAALRALPLRRAQTLWRGALALGNGARPADLPPALRPGA